MSRVIRKGRAHQVAPAKKRHTRGAAGGRGPGQRVTTENHFEEETFDELVAPKRHTPQTRPLSGAYDVSGFQEDGASQAIAIRLEPSVLTELDAVARHMGWTRTAAIKALFLPQLRLMAQCLSASEARRPVVTKAVTTGKGVRHGK